MDNSLRILNDDDPAKPASTAGFSDSATDAADLLIHPHPALAKKALQISGRPWRLGFSDKPPGADVPVEVTALPVSESPVKVSIRNRGTQEAPVLAAINDYYGPIEVEISAERIENMRAEPPCRYGSLFPPGLK